MQIFREILQVYYLDDFVDIFCDSQHRILFKLQQREL